jgi:hypothetical protein
MEVLKNEMGMKISSYSRIELTNVFSRESYWIIDAPTHSWLDQVHWQPRAGAQGWILVSLVEESVAIVATRVGFSPRALAVKRAR